MPLSYALSDRSTAMRLARAGVAGVRAGPLRRMPLRRNATAGTRKRRSNANHLTDIRYRRKRTDGSGKPGGRHEGIRPAADGRLDRRELIKAAVAGAGALALPSAAFAQDAPRKGGTLRLAMPYNPAALDPMTGRNLPDLNTLYAVFDALIDFVPETLELKPGLAKSWSFTDPTTLVLELVEGVNFHDGTPFNAEAVKFNLDRYKNDPRSNVKADIDIGRKRRGDRQEPGDAEAQPAECRPAEHPDQPDRPDRLAEIDPGQGRQRRPHAGRHRPLQVRQLAGQQQHLADPQRELLEAGPALSRRHRHQDHQRAEHRGARRRRRRSGPRDQPAGAAEGDRRPLVERGRARPRRRWCSTAPS